MEKANFIYDPLSKNEWEPSVAVPHYVIVGSENKEKMLMVKIEDVRIDRSELYIRSGAEVWLLKDGDYEYKPW
jgi:hypothetical protein